MKHTKVVLTTILALLIVTTSLQIIPEKVRAESTLFDVISVSWDPVLEVGPHDTATLKITLQYLGFNTLSSVTGNLTIPTKLGTLNTPIAYHTVQMRTYTIFTLDYVVKVSETATPKDYLAILQILTYPYEQEEELEVTISLSGKPILDAQLTTHEVPSGDAELKLEIVNTGSTSAADIHVEVTPLQGIVIENTKYNIAQLFPNQYVELLLKVRTPKNYEQTTISITVTLEYQGPKGAIYTETETVNVFVKTSPNPFVTIDLDLPTRLYPGRFISTLTVVNKGEGTAENTRIEITTGPGVSINNSLIDVESLGSLDERNFTLEIKVTTISLPSSTNLNFVWSYEDQHGWKFTDTKAITILIDEPLVEPKVQIKLDTEEFKIGKENEAVIEVMNTGTYSVEGLEVNLQSSSPTQLLGATRIFIDALSPNETREYPLRAYIPSNQIADTTTLTTAVRYLDHEFDSIVSDTFSFTVFLVGFIEMNVVDYAIIPKNPRPDQPFSVTVTLTNTGTSTAYSAIVFPVVSVPITIFGSKSVYVGNINVDTPTTFTLNLMLQNTTLPTLKVPVTLTYLDNLRTPFNVTYEFPMDISHEPDNPESPSRPATSEFGLLTYVIIGVVGVVVAVYAYRRYKKRG